MRLSMSRAGWDMDGGFNLPWSGEFELCMCIINTRKMQCIVGANVIVCPDLGRAPLK